MSAAIDAMDPARRAAAELDADVYVYNGSLMRGRDFSCIEAIAAHRSRESVFLVLTTHGGDPDAAYKIARYLQESYRHITVLVGGFCKSAGTLIAIGAHQLVFMPAGELGPLDVQLTKTDKFEQMQSGLVISESLITLEERVKESFYKMIRELIDDNQGLISFAAATKVSSDVIIGLYAPIMARIDPEEVGARSRAMRIASDYGRRLSEVSKNVKKDTLKLLTETYSSHSFVIDKGEAERLFTNVRWANEKEAALATALGTLAISETRRRGDAIFLPLSVRPQTSKSVGKKTNEQQPKASPHAPGFDGGNPSGSTRTSEPAAEKPNGRTRPAGRGRTAARRQAPAGGET
jgi:Serine dehydrogenase proteinase